MKKLPQFHLLISMLVVLLCNSSLQAEQHKSPVFQQIKSSEIAISAQTLLEQGLDSGQDYLYSQSYFILVELPCEAQQALQVAS